MRWWKRSLKGRSNLGAGFWIWSLIGYVHDQIFLFFMPFNGTFTASVILQYCSCLFPNSLVVFRRHSAVPVLYPVLWLMSDCLTLYGLCASAANITAKNVFPNKYVDVHCFNFQVDFISTLLHTIKYVCFVSLVSFESVPNILNTGI